MSYYDNSQWPAGGGQAGWEQQTPPARSGASSAIPREESAAFVYQLEEVDRAVDNLVKSGKMFGMSGGRHGRMGAGAGGSRPHSVADYGDSRGGAGPGGGPGGGPGVGGGGPHQQNSSSNLQNFYATQRHQSSRGSNEAEQMMQAKRRMAAQRERELRNYHQEQQYNRTVVAEFSGGYATKPDRSLSPGSMSEDERRELIARQRSALYGEGPFAESGTFDESGPRPSLSGSQGGGPPGLRGHSPLAYEYGRSPPAHADAAGPQPPTEGAAATATGSQSAGPNQRSRANSNASPQSNAPSNKGVFDAAAQQQSSRTSASSPAGSPPRVGGGPPGGGKSSGQGNTVAPIGTRPSGTSAAPANPALTKRSTTPLPSPLSQGYSAAAPGSGEDGGAAASSSVGGSSRAPSNPSSGTTEGPAGVGLSGWGGRSGGWGNKSGLGVQASVWG